MPGDRENREQDPSAGTESASRSAAAHAGNSAGRMGLLLRIVASAWLLFHLTGIFVSPASVPPSSLLMRQSWRVFGPYLQFLFMNHGFHFFAPDPGPATVLQYEVELPDRSRVQGQIPDLKAHWPRLLYHRHFMLTEFLITIESDQWSHIKPLLIRAFARELCREHGATSIRLTRVTHLLPSPEWRKSGMPFDAPEMFEKESLGTFQWNDL